MARLRLATDILRTVTTDGGRAASVQENAELGEFLRTRRSRVKPEDVGLTPYGTRRRVHGLRREEVAQMAGVSPEYYTRLEQGRHPTASPAVLNALARALRLPADERSYLYALARAVDNSPDAEPAAADQEALTRMLDVFGLTPAVLCGPFSDILGANDAARFLYDTDFSRLPAPHRNSIHWMLTAPAARALYDEHWEQTATEMIGKLRAESGRRPHHPRAQALVARLEQESELFRQVWHQHEISTCVQGIKILRHRLGGVLRMRSEAVTLHSSPSQVFYVMLAVDDAFEAAYRKFSCSA
jgi:transcriptional regulator with XRE-family HTH domain